MSSALGHLIRRFGWSLRTGRRPLDVVDERWLHELVGPRLAPWVDAMAAPDRRHAFDGARFVATVPGLDPEVRHDAAIAAALHDVGKLPSALGTAGRVVATVVGRLVPDRLPAPPEAFRWEPGVAPVRGWRRRIGAYLDHDAVGEVLLERSAAPELAVVWAAEHHLRPADRTVDAALATVLDTADEPAIRSTPGSKVPL